VRARTVPPRSVTDTKAEWLKLWSGSSRYWIPRAAAKERTSLADALAISQFSPAIWCSDLKAQFPFVSSWLTAKLLLLVVYILLGIFALRRGRTRLTRQVCFVAALSVYAFIISIAMTHNPRGLFAFL
jgi:hypothetical protein